MKAVDQPTEHSDDEATRRMATGWKWVSEYTPNPHPSLGRDGIVCPYMARALRRRYVRMEPFDATRGEPALLELARELRDDMQRRAADMDSDKTYLVSIVVPHGLPEEQLRSLVMRAHDALRPDFVRSGYVPGDFWPEHSTTGLHNVDFRPFNSPIPMLGMRALVPADLVFFCKQENSPERRMTYLRLYREVFDGQLNDYWASMLTDAEQRTEKELAAAQIR